MYCEYRGYVFIRAKSFNVFSLCLHNHSTLAGKVFVLQYATYAT